MQTATQIAALGGHLTDALHAEQDIKHRYYEALREEASTRAVNLTSDPAMLAEWLQDRMESSAVFAERLLDFMVERLEIEVAVEWSATRSAL